MPESSDYELRGLVNKFADAVLAQERAEDADEGNRHARRYVSAFEKLAQEGDEGREALSELLTHEHPLVRCAAASFLLRYKHDAATQVLRELSMRPDLIGFGAQCSIKNWYSGDWELDPEPPPSK